MRKTTPLMAGAALAGWLAALPAVAQDAALIAAARQEGQVVWYTTLLAAQLAEPMAAAFERKFGVKTTYVSLPSDLPLRVLSEAQAGRHIADVIDGPTSVTPLKAQGLILKWTPAAATNFPPELVDPDGYWMATNLYVQTMGFNTDLVQKGSEPRSMEDFLDPNGAANSAGARTAPFPAGRASSARHCLGWAKTRASIIYGDWRSRTLSVLARRRAPYSIRRSPANSQSRCRSSITTR